MQSDEQHPAVRSTSRDIARRAGVTMEVVAKAFDAILEEIYLGKTVVIDGFGKFRAGKTPERVVRTPIIEGGVAVQRSRRCIRFNQARGASRRLNKELSGCGRPDTAGMSEGDHLVSVRVVAETLAINREIVRRWARLGQIPAVRLGRVWRFSSKMLDSVVEGALTLPTKPEVKG